MESVLCGARWIINQIGFDSRKIHELIAWLRQRGWGRIPLIGNVYVLSPGATRLFRRYPERNYEITEGECEQEDLLPGKDEHGNDIFVPNPQGAYGTVHTAK